MSELLIFGELVFHFFELFSFESKFGVQLWIVKFSGIDLFFELLDDVILKLIFLLVLILKFSEVSCSFFILLELSGLFTQFFSQLGNHLTQVIVFLGHYLLKFFDLSDEPTLLFLHLSFKIFFALMLLIDHSLKIVDHPWWGSISFFIACFNFFQLSLIILFGFLTLIFEKLLSLAEWILSLWSFSFKLLANL